MQPDDAGGRLRASKSRSIRQTGPRPSGPAPPPGDRESARAPRRPRGEPRLHHRDHRRRSRPGSADTDEFGTPPLRAPLRSSRACRNASERNRVEPIPPRSIRVPRRSLESLDRHGDEGASDPPDRSAPSPPDPRAGFRDRRDDRPRIVPRGDPSLPGGRAPREAGRLAIAEDRIPPSTTTASLRGVCGPGRAASMEPRGPASPPRDRDADRRGSRRRSTGRGRRRGSVDRFDVEDDLPVRSCSC